MNGLTGKLSVVWHGMLTKLNHLSRGVKVFRPGPTQTGLVQPQKMARGLKFRTQKKEGLYYLCAVSMQIAGAHLRQNEEMSGLAWHAD